MARRSNPGDLSRMRRLLVIGLLLVLSACKKPEIPAPVIRPAQVWTVNEQANTTKQTYSGEVKARYEADLAFRVGGKINKRSVDLGSNVKAGQVLASLDTTDLNLNSDAARANLRSALSEQATAKAELERNRDLFRQNFISKAALETYMNRYNAAQANVKAVSAQVDLAQNQSDYSDLKSDKNGVVTTIYSEAGQVVSAGQPVLRLAYEGEREIHIRVGEITAQNLKPGTNAEIKFWSQNDGSSYQGTVREISPATDATRSFLVKIALNNPPANLRLGMTADVSFSGVNDNGQTLWLPATALYQQGKEPAVWIIDQNKSVHLQTVQVLAYQEDGVSIKGIPTGTQIIAAGVHKLTEGQVINPVPYNGKAGS